MIDREIGHYRILDRIASGGMGTVWKAEDSRLGRQVALKTLSGQLMEDPEARERFVREAQAASSLNHPNITVVHALLEEPDEHIICMEYIEGKTVRDMLESGRVGVKKAVDIVRQTADALAAAHRQGILHRDVKSSNIMVTLEGRVKVLDFGLAHLESPDQLTRSGTTLGTLSYTAPEHLAGRTYDERSELWSLGVVFYELLTGRLPFQGDSEAETVFAIVNNEPEPPGTLREDLPRPVGEVALRLLEKDPAARYGSMSELVDELERLYRGLETSTLHLPLAEVPRPRGRRRLLAGAAAATVVVLGALAVLRFGGGPNLDPGLVVIPVFEDRTGADELAGLGRLAADQLVRAIQYSEVVDPVAVTEPLVTGGGGAERATTRGYEAVRRLARRNAAAYVVTGYYTVTGPEIAFYLEVVDAREPRLLTAVDPIGLPRERADELPAVVGERMAALLAFNLHQFYAHWASFPPPRTMDQLRPYERAMECFWRSDYEQAARLLEEMLVSDPEWSAPPMALIWTLINLGRREEARAVLADLGESIEAPSDAEMLGMEMARASLDEEVETFYRLARRYAESSPAGHYQAGLLCLRTNRPREGIEHLAQMDPDTPLLADWQYYWSVYADCLHLLGEHRRELKIIREGRRRLPESTVLLGVEIRALAALNRTREIERLLATDAVHLAQPPARTPYRFYGTAATWLNAHHHAPELVTRFRREALAWYREHQSQSPSGYANSIALMHYGLDEYGEAERIWRELAAEAPDDIGWQGCLGTIAARTGRREEALRVIDWLGERGTGNALYWQACVAAQLGDLDQAVWYLRAASRKVSVYVRAAWDADLDPLREHPPFIEFMEPRG